MNLYPYSNFHDMNLDWIINEVKKAINEWLQMQENFKGLKDDFEELKTYVQDYFKNLNVQEEINNKIDDMIKSGEFKKIFRDYSQTAVNDEFYRYWMSDIAQGYIKHFSEFVYGGKHAAFRPSVIQVGGKWEINCSTFGVLMSAGISFENSKYGGGQNERNGLGLNDEDFIKWFSSPHPGTSGEKDEDWNYTYNIAERLYKEGKTFYPEKDLSNVQTGDLLYLALEPDPGVENPFMGITHCAVFAYKSNDNTYAVWEVGSAGPVEAKYPIKYANDNLVLCSRFACKQSQIFNSENLISNSLTKYTSDSALLRACSPIKGNFEAGKQYTLVAKINYDYELPTVYPGISDSNSTRLVSDYGATKKPSDSVYIIPFSPKVDTPFIYLQTIASEEGLPRNASCEWCAVYRGLALYRKNVPKQFARNIEVKNNDNYKITLSSYYDYDSVSLFFEISGKLVVGNNDVGIIKNNRVTTLIQPLCATMISAVAGGKMCSAYIDNRGSEHAIRIVIPEGESPEKVYAQITIPTTEREF